MPTDNLQSVGKHNISIQLVNSKMSAVYTMLRSHTHEINKMQIYIPQSVLRVLARTKRAVFPSTDQSYTKRTCGWQFCIQGHLTNIYSPLPRNWL